MDSAVIYYNYFSGLSDCQWNCKKCIGKAEDAELRIEKDTISRYHARIDAKNKEYYIEDLNSTNGTYINDELLPYKEVRQLKSNDIIRFADVKYRFL